MIMCILFIGMLLIWECSKLVLNKTIETYLTINTIDDETKPTTVRDYAQKLQIELDKLDKQDKEEPSDSTLANNMKDRMNKLKDVLNPTFLTKFEIMYDDRNGSPNSGSSNNKNSLWSLINPVNVRINEYSNEVEKLEQELKTLSAENSENNRKADQATAVANKEIGALSA